jgi:endo-1,4-beta-xylanase
VRRGVWVGACVAAAPFAAEPEYAETLGRECNVVTPENEMKWGPIHPTPDGYDFARADAIVQFAQSRGMAVHGHTLVWHNQNPAWLVDQAGSRDAAIRILRDHIAAVAGRYAAAVDVWDVVNEAVGDDGTLRATLWRERIGPEYLEIAFRAAAEAAPRARLVYNDYGAEPVNAKSDGIYRLLSDLLSAGVPVHGAGFQCHLTDAGVDLDRFAKNLERFGGLGLALYVTEMDVRLPLPATPESLARQAAIYRGVLETCLAQPSFRGFQTWGIADRHSWIPRRFPGSGAALPFDEQYRPKPAYHELRRCLMA